VTSHDPTGGTGQHPGRDVGSNGTREIGVDADQTVRRLYTHRIGDLPVPIAPLAA
jgi:hypothetical protein